SEPEASKNHLTERRSVRTAVATISYLEDGPSDGSPVFFLHGFPDDPKGLDKVGRRKHFGTSFIFVLVRGNSLWSSKLRSWQSIFGEPGRRLGNSRPKNCKRSCLLSATLC